MSFSLQNKSKKTSNKYVFAAPSKIQGNGLFARTNIPAGVEIVEYDGPRVSENEGQKLAEEGNTFVFQLDNNTYIDGSVKWNLARHANHSCGPNAKPVKINGKIWLKTIRGITKGEEITYNYGYSFNNHEDNPCNCGFAGCAGYMVQEKHRNRVNNQ